MPDTVLMVGGFERSMQLDSIARGFEKIGLNVLHLPSRGVVKQKERQDVGYAKGECRMFPDSVVHNVQWETVVQWSDHMVEMIKENGVKVLFWWTCKHDKPRGLIDRIRKECPFCNPVFHSCDDPIQIHRGKTWMDEFKFAVTSCVTSVDAYAEKGIKAVPLYPPVDSEIHGCARPSPAEVCDVGFSPSYLYHRNSWKEAFASRSDMILMMRDLARDEGVKIHLYGTMNQKPRDLGSMSEMHSDPILQEAWRGWHEYEELPGIYAANKIHINNHALTQEYCIQNVRFAQIWACAGFELCDKVNGFYDMMPDCTPAWKTLDELRRLILYYLAHADERALIIMEVYKYVHEHYSNTKYAQTVIDMIEGGQL